MLRRRQARRHERKRRCGPLKSKPCERIAQRTREPAQHQSEPEASRMRQDFRQEEAPAALNGRAAPLRFDAAPGEIDEMHIVDAARTGGHAGEAREAAVDMVGRRRRHLALLEHLLHQVDAAARAVALIAREHVSRAGRRAEAAMNATAQDFVGAGDRRIGELDVVEIGLHGQPRSPDTCGRD